MGGFVWIIRPALRANAWISKVQINKNRITTQSFHGAPLLGWRSTATIAWLCIVDEVRIQCEH